MSCNFLMKFENDEKYEHYILNSCHTAIAQGGCISYFMSKYPDIKVSNFVEEVPKGGVCTTIWCKYIHGVSIWEEKYGISIGKQQIMKDPKLGMNPDNIIEGTSIQSRLLESKEPILLPYFLGDI